MPNTARMRWPFPKEGQDPWFTAFLGMVNAMDSSGFTDRENDAVVLMEGGTFTFTASSGVITWSGTIEILAAITGFTWRLAPGSISLGEGEILYITATRSPSGNIVLTPKKSNQLPNTDEALFLAIRKGARTFWRNGRVLATGDAIQLFNQSTAAGTGGLKTVALTLNDTIPDPTFRVAGTYILDSDDFLGVNFTAVANVSNGTTSGEIQLFNLTDVTQEALLTFTELVPTRKETGSLSLPSGLKTYEARIRLVGGSGPSDLLFATWVGFEI